MSQLPLYRNFKALVSFSEFFRIKETVLCFEVATKRAVWTDVQLCFLGFFSGGRDRDQSVRQGDLSSRFKVLSAFICCRLVPGSQRQTNNKKHQVVPCMWIVDL